MSFQTQKRSIIEIHNKNSEFRLCVSISIFRSICYVYLCISNKDYNVGIYSFSTKSVVKC